MVFFSGHNAMQGKWYIKPQEQGSVYGPYSGEELQNFIQSGKIKMDFLLSCDSQNWSTLEDAFQPKSGPKPVTRVMPSRPVSLHSQFGNYEILEILGKGGMGVVYKAKDIKLGRLVALKCIREESANEEWKKRFLREAQLNASLDHPNIVRVLESSDQPKPYIAMEYLQGRPLSALIQEGLLSIQQKVEIFRQICEAIEYAHRQKIIHRDIKPANIMVLNNGTVKVMDFGLAKNLDVSQSFSHVGQIMGTPKYMSPEQARGKKVDKRTDIYALGAVFYEMLTHRTPYDGNTIYQILLQIAEKDPIPPRELNPEIPQDLQTITLKCLEKKAERRYYSTRVLCKDLELFLANKPIQAKDPNLLERMTKWIQRNRVASVLILAITICLVLAVFSLREYYKKYELLEEKQKYLLAQHYKEGCSLFHQQKFEHAIQSFSYALKQQDDLKSYWMMACSYMILGKIELAQECLQRKMGNAPVQFLLLQSLCHAEKKNMVEAREFWENAKKRFYSQKKALDAYLSDQSNVNLKERMDFIMPLPEEKLAGSNARYFALLALLPIEENKTAQHFLRKKEARESYTEEKALKQMLDQEFYKTGYVLYKTDTGWCKNLLQEVPALELKEMMYYVKDRWILDMASPYWTRLAPQTQAKYANLYQKAYAEERGISAHKVFRENRTEFSMVLVPPGQFLLGKAFEKEGDGPQRQVVMMDSYWIGNTEATQKQWLEIAGSRPWRKKNEQGQEEIQDHVLEHPDAPITCVSYEKIESDFLSKIATQGYSLPDEIEWEYACRAGTTSLGFWGDEAAQGYLWYKENAIDKENFLHSKIQKVAQKKPNAWGLYDMAGNAAELCSNGFFDYASFAVEQKIKQEIRMNQEEKSSKIYRGGHISSSIEQCYSSRRDSAKKNIGNPVLSFRLLK